MSPDRVLDSELKERIEWRIDTVFQFLFSAVTLLGAIIIGNLTWVMSELGAGSIVVWIGYAISIALLIVGNYVLFKISDPPKLENKDRTGGDRL